MTEVWLLKKRGLYYRPNDCGYTGIRDFAARYTGDEARARMSPGVSMVLLEHAAEFSEACIEDLARDHLTKQRDALRAALAYERGRCAQIAATWKSSLRPGTIARLLGHQEAAREIAAAILEQGTQPK